MSFEFSTNEMDEVFIQELTDQLNRVGTTNQRTTLGEFGFITTSEPINVNTTNKTLEFPNSTEIFATYRNVNLHIGDQYKNQVLDAGFGGSNGGFIYFDARNKMIEASVELPNDHEDYIIIGYIFWETKIFKLNMNLSVNGLVRPTIGEYGWITSRLPINIDTINRKIEFPNTDEIYATYRNINYPIGSSIKNTSIVSPQDGFVFFDTINYKIKAGAALPSDSENYIILGYIFWSTKTFKLNMNLSIDGQIDPTLGEYGFITSDQPININTTDKTMEFPNTDSLFATYRGVNMPLSNYKNTKLDISFGGFNGGFVYLNTNTFELKATPSLPSDHDSYIILGYIFLWSHTFQLNMNYIIDGISLNDKLVENTNKLKEIEGDVISNIYASSSGPRASTFIIQLVYDTNGMSTGDVFKFITTINNKDSNVKQMYCLFYTNDKPDLNATDGTLNESSREAAVLSEKEYVFNGLCGNSGRYLHVFLCVELNDGNIKSNISVKGFPKLLYKDKEYRYETLLSNLNFYSISPGDNISSVNNKIVRVSEVASYINVLASNPLDSKKWNAIGDSLTYGHTLGPSITFSTLIGKRNNMTVRNYGQNGTWLSSSREDSMVNRYISMDKDADYITVFGGTNDFFGIVNIGSNDDNTKDTFKGALNIMCKGLIEMYPKAKIGFITPYHFTDEPNSNGIYLIELVDAIIEICSRYGIPVLDNYRTGTLLPINEVQRETLMLDGLHPDANGHKFISTRIEAFLKSL